MLFLAPTWQRPRTLHGRCREYRRIETDTELTLTSQPRRETSVHSQCAGKTKFGTLPATVSLHRGQHSGRLCRMTSVLTRSAPGNNILSSIPLHTNVQTPRSFVGSIIRHGSCDQRQERSPRAVQCPDDQTRRPNQPPKTAFMARRTVVQSACHIKECYCNRVLLYY